MGMTDEQWDTVGVRLYEWLNEDRKREEAADRRAKEIADVHREGWRNFNRTVEAGLRAIADALRGR
jgi:hypothetical protein